MKHCQPPDITTIGGRIRYVRMRYGYYIKDFAKMLNISTNHLGLVERNEKTPSYKLIQKIAKITETPYQWLLNNKPCQNQKQIETQSPQKDLLQIINMYAKLNQTGKAEALKRIEQLTRLVEYQQKD